MPEYRRWFEPGGTFFFTIVTYDRHPLFLDPDACRLLGSVLREVRCEQPFQIPAIVLLPDHIHCLWTMPREDSDYPRRWNQIKGRFTQRWIASGGNGKEPTPSQASRRIRGIWQPRYWEHLIRDEDDFGIHFDYIHFNPVKHRLASHPADWPWSTYHRYVRDGTYPAEWGRSEPQSTFGLALE